MKDANKCTAKTLPIMKEGRQFEEDTSNNCTICYQQYKSPMEVMKHMLSHNPSNRGCTNEASKN